MSEKDKTVFLSYRRDKGFYEGRSLFLDLRAHGYDVFWDIERIDSGTFDTVTLNQIAARAHFILVLTPGTLDRTTDEVDLFARGFEVKEEVVMKDEVKATKLEITLPFGIGKITLEPDEVEREAAWELYVELSTRISSARIVQAEGLVREALTSLYSILNSTREILRKAGPSVAHGPDSFGPIAIRVVNKGVRPFLDHWHSELLMREQNRPPEVSAVVWEREWDRYYDFWGELGDLQSEIWVYIQALEKIARVQVEA